MRGVARLYARPAPPTRSGPAGTHELRLRQDRRALLHVPKTAAMSSSASLAVMLHGAGGNARHGLDLLSPYADQANVIVLAPESWGTSWDIISESRYGPDVQFIDECLNEVFAQYSIAPSCVALGGFSDGASYALSLGLSNGFLFPRILAFSPGFMAPVRYEDQPSIFVSHGLRDEVLRIDPCSRKLVRVLRAQGFDVEYQEFDGPHTVPPEMRKRALDILLAAG